MLEARIWHTQITTKVLALHILEKFGWWPIV